MRAIVVRIALIAAGIAAAISAQTAIAHADGPPKLDVSPSCAAAARGAVILGRDKEACLGDERAAQDTLTKGWNKYNATDRTQCVNLVRQGGPASYVELLSCLEVMRDSKTIRATEPLAAALPQQTPGATSTGAAQPSRRRGRRSQPGA